MQDWARSHRDEIDADRDTVASVTRRMRADGICTSLNASVEALACEGIKVGREPARFVA